MNPASHIHSDAPVGQLMQLCKFLQEPYTPVTSYQQYLLQNLTTLKRKVMLHHDKLLYFSRKLLVTPRSADGNGKKLWLELYG